MPWLATLWLATLSPAALGAGCGSAPGGTPGPDVIAADAGGDDVDSSGPDVGGVVAADANVGGDAAVDAIDTVTNADATIDAIDAAVGVDASADAHDGLTDGDGSGGDDATADPCAPIGACIQCAPPAPGDPVSPLPMPPPCGCDHGGPAFFGEASIPKATLQPTLGYQRYGEADFIAYQDGGWAGLWKGPQGFFHIFLGVRVALPGQKADKVKLQLEAFAFDGTELVAAGQAPTIFASREAPGSDVFRSTNAENPGVWVVFPHPLAKAIEFCNRWFEVVGRVRVLGTDAWGQTSVTVRTYHDAKL